MTPEARALLRQDELEMLDRAEKASPSPFEFCAFTHHSGRDIETNTDVAETVAFSAMQSDKAVLWGVALPEKDESGLNVVVAYTGNGPNSSNNANFLAATRTDVPELLSRLAAARAGERETLSRIRQSFICRADLPYFDELMAELFPVAPMEEK